MKKIAVINDLSGLGKCSLTAAIPVISVMGVQACPFPTAVLSNQTGYETYFCEDFTEHMAPYMEEWKKRGFVPDGIYTGFLSDEKQADKILKFIDTFAGEDTLILTDPVMGDDGAVYPIYTEELCSRFRELARRSYVITPNLTEALLLLYGKNKMEEKETFIMIDENGNEKEAEIITIIEIDNKEYVIYAVNKNEESDNIFASRIIKDENGNDVIKSIENQEEKNKVFEIIKELLSNS